MSNKEGLGGPWPASKLDFLEGGVRSPGGGEAPRGGNMPGRKGKGGRPRNRPGRNGERGGIKRGLRGPPGIGGPPLTLRKGGKEGCAAVAELECFCK